MARPRSNPPEASKPRRRSAPSVTDEDRENRLISMAQDLAERQLREGTASSQVISHYLKLGSSKERLEKEMLEEKVKLLEARTEAIAAAKRSEELYAKAIEAMRMYGGHGGDSDYEEYEE